MNINYLTDGQKTVLLESLTESKKSGNITNAELLILKKLQKTVFEKRVEVTQYKKDGCIKRSYETIADVRGDEKIRIETGFSDWGMRFQNLKEGPFGEYVTILNQRWYIEFI